MILEPDLWKALKAVKRGQLVRRGPFLFWRSSRSDTIRRVWMEDYRIVGKRGIPQEKMRFWKQTTLDTGPSGYSRGRELCAVLN